VKKSIFIILIIATFQVKGQSHLIGVNLGIGYSNVTSVWFPTQNRNRKVFSGGLSYEYLFKKHLLFDADFIYNQRGFDNNNIKFLDVDYQPTGQTASSQFKYEYVSFPIKSGYNIGNKIFGLLKIGVIPSILVQANTSTVIFDIDKNIIGTEFINETKSVNKFDISGIIEISGGYKFKN
jgi:hypothetical protein